MAEKKDYYTNYLKEYNVEERLIQADIQYNTGKGLVDKIPEHNIHEKNEEDIKKATIMGDILNRISDDIEKGQHDDMIQFKESMEEDEYITGFGANKRVPVRGLFHRDELAKALYLNNENPYKYNLDFFTEYFGIDKDRLRIIFKSISYPIVNMKDGNIESICRFYEVTQ